MEHDFTLRDYKRACFKRIDHNKDVFNIVVGEPGAGKSNYAFQMAWSLDPAFNADRMLFSGPRFVEVTSKLDAYPPGSAFVIDEAVIGAWAGSWSSKENNDLAKYLMVFRSRKFHTFLLMPFLLDVHKPVKRRAHWLHEVRELDTADEAAVVMFQRNKVRQFSNRPPGFTKRLEFNVHPLEGGRTFSGVPVPADMLAEWVRYERMKSTSVATFTGGMDAGRVDVDRRQAMQVQARAILGRFKVPVKKP